jgi:hypothetical protein
MPELDNINAATERIASRSISNAGFSVSEGGRAAMKLIITEDKLEAAIKEAISGAKPLKAGIQRKLPVAHPQFQWLFCERISNIEGVEFDSKIDATAEDAFFDTYVEAPPITNYARYKRYEISLDFTPRPYAVLPDTNLSRYILTFINEDGTNEVKSHNQEFLRYTEYRRVPSSEYLTAENGQMIWKMDANPAAPVVLQNIAVAGGQLRMLIRSAQVEYKFYEVPYSFITSSKSFIARASGLVNQLDWNGHKAGSLLMLGTAVDRVYTSPFPEWVDTGDGYVPSQQKLCDLTFQMLERDQAPAIAYTGIADNNEVPYGHNLLFNPQTALWYYAVNKNTGKPTYASFPFQLLFANPDQ